MPGDLEARGADLANLIHGLDRQIGYPFAWFFHMLTDKRISHRLAEAVHTDLTGAYPPTLKIVASRWAFGMSRGVDGGPPWPLRWLDRNERSLYH